MDRTRWTDDRLDDAVARLDRDIRDLRTEMHQGFDVVNGRLDGLSGRIDDMQTTMIRLGGAMIVCLLGAIVAFALGGS